MHGRKRQAQSGPSKAGLDRKTITATVNRATSDKTVTKATAVKRRVSPSAPSSTGCTTAYVRVKTPVSLNDDK